MAKLYPETRKKYYISHKEKTLAYRKQHHINNIDRAHELNRLWRLNNKLKIFESNLRNAHNITLEQYNEMFNNQNGCCAICGIHQKELNKALCVDHDHETCEIRGLLCQKCNSLLGYSKDSIDILLLAIVYLSKTKRDLNK